MIVRLVVYSLQSTSQYSYCVMNMSYIKRKLANAVKLGGVRRSCQTQVPPKLLVISVIRTLKNRLISPAL